MSNLVNITYTAEKIVPKEHTSLHKKTLRNQSAVGLKVGQESIKCLAPFEDSSPDFSKALIKKKKKSRQR